MYEPLDHAHIKGINLAYVLPDFQSVLTPLCVHMLASPVLSMLYSSNIHYLPSIQHPESVLLINCTHRQLLVLPGVPDLPYVFNNGVLPLAFEGEFGVGDLTEGDLSIGD